MTHDSLQRQQAASSSGEVSTPARMTGRGAVLVMFAVFFTGAATAELLNVAVLTGLSVVVGCVLAARFARRSSLLVAAVSPPLIFLIAVICAEAVTTSSTTGHSGFLSAAEGTILMLAGAAPWLFAGAALSLVIAMLRGLPQCIRDLRERVRGR